MLMPIFLVIKLVEFLPTLSIVKSNLIDRSSFSYELDFQVQ